MTEPVEAKPATARGLVGGGLLARNTALNLFGHLAPLVVALVAIPRLIDALGAERFGVLTIAWMVIGYFSLFDLGLSRALTQLIAERLGSGREDEVPELAWTALTAMFAMGVVGAVVMAIATPWIAGSALKVPDALLGEALPAFYLLALSLPWVVSTAGLRGILEAEQRFGVVNALRVPMGVITFLGPLLVLPFSHSLVPVTAVLVAARLLIWAAHLAAVLLTTPALRKTIRPEWAYLRSLLRFGGWMTVSNVVSPIMVYFDRILIAAVLSLAAVTYYVTPYEVVVKLLVVPSALLGVFFPAFAAAYASNRERVALLFDRVFRILLLALFPVCLILVTGAEEGLRLWLGESFARESAHVLQWLAVGVFINSLGHAPFAMVQGAGRPDVTGKIHLVELPLYAALIWTLTRAYGIEGAAIAWTIRVAVDTGVLLEVVRRLLPESRPHLARLVPSAVVLTLALALGAVSMGTGAKLLFLGVMLAGFAVVGWSWLLWPGARAMVRRSARFRADRPALEG